MQEEGAPRRTALPFSSSRGPKTTHRRKPPPRQGRWLQSDQLPFVEGSALVDEMVAELVLLGKPPRHVGNTAECVCPVASLLNYCGVKLSQGAAEENLPCVVRDPRGSACFGTGIIVPPRQDSGALSRNTRTTRSVKTKNEVLAGTPEDFAGDRVWDRSPLPFLGLRDARRLGGRNARAIRDSPWDQSSSLTLERADQRPKGPQVARFRRA